jgi:uncharacterized protein
MPVFDLADCLPKLARYLSEQPDVLLAYVFGSQARGQAHLRSDLDVAVLLEGDPERGPHTDRRLDLVGGLGHLLDSNDVDVVVLNGSPLALRYRVIRDGKLAFARSRDVAIEYRVRSLNLYFDFEPLLKRDEQAFFDRIRQGRFLDGYNPYQGTIPPDPPFARATGRDQEA